jgi:hypothetical protein
MFFHYCNLPVPIFKKQYFGSRYEYSFCRAMLKGSSVMGVMGVVQNHNEITILDNTLTWRTTMRYGLSFHVKRDGFMMIARTFRLARESEKVTKNSHKKNRR